MATNARSWCSELIRFACVAAAAVLLNQPEWVEEFRPDEKAAVVVLYDDSPSMDTRDALRIRPTAGPARDQARGDREPDQARILEGAGEPGPRWSSSHSRPGAKGAGLT